MDRHSSYNGTSRSHAISLKDWTWRLSFITLLSISLTMIVLSTSEHRFAKQVRAGFADQLMPLVAMVAEPLAAAETLNTTIQQWVEVYHNNEQLTAENRQLKKWRLLASELEAENRALRELLHTVPKVDSRYISARVLGEVGSSYSRSAYVNAGLDNMVAEGMAAVNGEGLVGRVIESGDYTSRLLLLTDLNSRIAVISENSRERGIAVGRNGKLLELNYLPKDSTLKIGEQLLTSGDAKLIPAGIPVGTVTAIENGKVMVAPLVDWSRLDYISLIQPAS